MTRLSGRCCGGWDVDGAARGASRPKAVRRMSAASNASFDVSDSSGGNAVVTSADLQAH